VGHYLTVPELAVLLKSSLKTVYRLAQKGGLPGFMAVGSWRFCRGDFDAWASRLVRRQQEEKN
jgi:excisionase family DNA binding protein